jgi:hypothetical protein
LRKIAKAVYVDVPPNIAYENIKTIDKEAYKLIQNFVNLRFQPAPFIKDIPNRKLVQLGRDWKVSFDFDPSGEGTNVIINAEQTLGMRLGNETLILIWLYALKGIEAGYKSKS